MLTNRATNRGTNRGTSRATNRGPNRGTNRDNTELIFDGPPADLFINKPVLEKTNLKPPQITAFAEAKNFGDNKKAILSVEEALNYV